MSQQTRAERESRDFALHATPEKMGISVQETGDGIWGIVADLGLPGATATVVASCRRLRGHVLG